GSVRMDSSTKVAWGSFAALVLLFSGCTSLLGDFDANPTGSLTDSGGGGDQIAPGQDGSSPNDSAGGIAATMTGASGGDSGKGNEAGSMGDWGMVDSGGEDHHEADSGVTCTTDQLLCSGTCTNQDNNNCGGCGHQCGATATCMSGRCACN